jgi:hypothetical protein
MATLEAQIDLQLRALGTPGTGMVRAKTPAEALPEVQRRAIEHATGEDAMTFLKRFKQAARRDLCQEGGVLYTQWQKWKDVTNTDILKTFGAVLVGMGLSGSALQIAMVEIAVYVLYLGVTAFCEEV